jgi:hypothetical protein
MVRSFSLPLPQLLGLILSTQSSVKWPIKLAVTLLTQLQQLRPVQVIAPSLTS